MSISLNGTPAWHTEPVDYNADAMLEAFKPPDGQSIWDRQYHREEAARLLKRTGLAVIAVGAALWLASHAVNAQMANPPIPQLKPPAETPAVPSGPNPAACGPMHSLAKYLKDRYDEAPNSFGLQSNGNLLQVYSSEEKGTWTMVSTTPTGVSCIVAEGKRWESLPTPSTDPMA
jgi:hypothetical protein